MGRKSGPVTTDPDDAIRLIQSGLDILGHRPSAIDGRWGVRTARALRQMIAANGRAASFAPQWSLPWITEAKTALGRNEARDRTWLMDWLKRDGRSLGDPSKTSWCGNFVETCIRMSPPDEPLLDALSTNPYWARNKWRLLGARWPATYLPRLQRLPTMKPGEFLTTTNEI